MGSYAIDRRPLSIPAFRRLWIASAVSAVGGSFSLIAVPTELFTLTGSSATIGTAAAVSFVALVVAALSSGALADIMDRRRLLLIAHTGLALTYAAFWAQAVLGNRSIAILLVLVAGQGLSYGAIMTTMGAAVPRLVPVELLPAAASLSSLARYTGAVVGPLLAGVLIPVVGLGNLFLFDALALLGVLWAVFRLPQLAPSGPGGGPGDNLGRGLGRGTGRGKRPAATAQLAEGFRYLFGHRLLLAVMAVDLSAMVFGMPAALFPELAERGYGGHPGDGAVLGLLFAAYPAGVFAVGLISGTFTRLRRHGALMVSAAIAWGATVIMFGLAPHLWLALAALGLGGAVNCLLSMFRNAITQASTDDALRGRIQGSVTIVLIGGPQTAGFVHGIAGSAWGARTAVCAGGLLTMVSVTAIAVAVPQLWRYVPQPTARKASRPVGLSRPESELPH